MALSADVLAAQLRRFTYRPGWHLVFDVDPYEGPVLWVCAEVPNSYRPDETVPLRIRSLIPPMADPDAFAEWLLWRVCQIESHEAREWLMRDGAALRDPHREQSPPS